MNKTSFNRHIIIFSTFILSIVSCLKDPLVEYQNPYLGIYNNDYVNGLVGFNELRAKILSQQNISNQDFIAWSTDSAWALTPDKQTKLKAIRNSIPMPTNQVLLQKVLPLADLSNYMDNVYGGTIGGFVCEAGDIKHVYKMYDIYWGLRLDYPGSKFKENGAGYAVIRFKSDLTSKLQPPYCKELGGLTAHAWPNTGGGFTSSKLGDGGIPEYTFDSYYPPLVGAELYEITPNGTEILRSVFQMGRWVTYEASQLAPFSKSESYKRSVYNGYKVSFNGNEFKAFLKEDGIILVSEKPANRFSYNKQTNNYTVELKRNEVTGLRLVQTNTTYRGAIFNVSGENATNFYLTTTDASLQAKIGLAVIEKGIYGIIVPKNSDLVLYENKVD